MTIRVDNLNVVIFEPGYHRLLFPSLRENNRMARRQIWAEALRRCAPHTTARLRERQGEGAGRNSAHVDTLASPLPCLFTRAHALCLTCTHMHTRTHRQEQSPHGHGWFFFHAAVRGRGFSARRDPCRALFSSPAARYEL